MTIPVKYQMTNRINGNSITIDGDGTVDSNGLKLNLTLSDTPSDWSGVIVPCICSGPGPGPDVGKRSFDLMSISKNGYRTSPGTLRVATLFDESGKSIASVRATGVYSKNQSGYNFKIDVDTTTITNTIIPDLKKVDHYSFAIHPHGPGNVAVYAHYSLSTSAGKKAYGFTYILYEFINESKSLASTILGFNEIDVNYSSRSKKLSYSTYQIVLPSATLGGI